MRFSLIAILFLLQFSLFRAELEVYIDSGADSPDPDGSEDNPYNSFQDAYDAKIKEALEEESVVVIFKYSEDPYDFEMSFIAENDDNTEFKLAFRSNVTESIEDMQTCDYFPTLLLKASEQFKTNQSLSDLSVGQKFVFKANYLTVSFENLRLVIEANDDTPYNGALLAQSSQSLEVSIKDVCFDFNEASVVNTTKDASFGFTSGRDIKVEIEGMAVNTALNIKAPEEENQNQTVGAAPNRINLFLFSTSAKKSPETSEFHANKILFRQAIDCKSCVVDDDVFLPLTEISMFTVSNIMKVEFEETTGYDMNSNVNNYMVHYPSGLTGTEISIKGTTLNDALNTTFLYSNSENLVLNIEETKLNNVKMTDIPFVGVKVANPRDDFSINIDDFESTSGLLSSTSLFDFSVTIAEVKEETYENPIQISNVKFTDCIISNQNRPRVPFIKSNYPYEFKDAEFDSNNWDSINIFVGSDTKPMKFKVSRSKFKNDVYAKTLMFLQNHQDPAAEKKNVPSVIDDCDFDGLSFGENSSFVMNRGFMFSFTNNRIDSMSIHDGQFIGSPYAPLPDLPFDKNNRPKGRKGKRDPPEDCETSCYFIEISENQVVSLAFDTEGNFPILPLIRPPKTEKAYVVVSGNKFDNVMGDKPFIFTNNIDSVEIIDNKVYNLKPPKSVFEINGTTPLLTIKENELKEIEALDVFSYLHKDATLEPSITIEGNQLHSGKYTRTFFTIRGEKFEELTVGGNIIEESELVCSPGLQQCVGIGVYFPGNDDSQYRFSGNKFNGAKLSIEGDREGYLPDFTNALFDVQILYSSTIKLGDTAFENCEMEAVFSSLLYVRGDKIEIDTLTVNGNKISNTNFEGAISILGSRFSLNDVTMEENAFQSNQQRHGFLTSALKLENPIADDGRVEVEIQGINFDNNDVSGLNSMVEINFPNLELRVSRGNFKGSKGKLILVNSNSYDIELNQVEFESGENSHLLYLPHGKGSLTLDDYKDTAGEGQKGHAIHINNGEDVTVTVTGSTIGNPSLLYANLTNSKIHFKDSKIENVPGKAGISQYIFSIIGKQIEVEFEKIQLQNNNAPGTSIFSVGTGTSSDITVTAKSLLGKSSTFSNFFDLTRSPKTQVTVMSSVFDNNVFTFAKYGDVVAPKPKGVDAATVFTMENSIFTRHLGSLVQASYGGTFDLKNVVVSESITTSDLAPANIALFNFSVEIAGSPVLQLADSTLLGVYSQKMVGILKSAQAVSRFQSLNVVNNTFLNATETTPVFGLSLDLSSLTIGKSNFLMNTATYSSGCLKLFKSDYNVTDSLFKNNVGNTGGVLYAASSTSKNTKDFSELNKLINNHGISYGDNISGDVSRIEVTFTNQCSDYNTTLFSKYLNDDIVHKDGNNFEVSDFSIFAWNCKALAIRFLDLNGSPVHIDPKSTTITATTAASTIIPDYKCSVSQCLLYPVSIPLEKADSSVTLSLSLSLAPNPPATTSAKFTFEPRACLSGEYLPEEDKKCRICPKNSFSFVVSSTCEPCPALSSQAICLGGDIMTIQKDSWKDPTSPSFYKCPDTGEDRCLGGGDPLDQCAEEYSGAMCLACNSTNKFGSTMFSTKCEKCGSKTGDVFLALLFFTLPFLFEIFYIVVVNSSNKASLVKMRKETFTADRYVLGIYLSFAVNQIQLVYIVLNFMKFLFPDYASQFQAIIGPIGFIASPSSFGRNSLECILANSDDSPLAIFKYKAYVETLLPLLKFMVIAFVFIFLYVMEKIKKIRSVLIVSLFGIITLEQAPAFLHLLQSVTCYLKTAVSHGYVKSDLRISCADPDFEGVRNLFVFPSMLFWSGFLFLVFVIGFFVVKAKLPATKVKRLFGDLINPYKDHNIYWGLILILFKLLLITTLNLIPRPSEAIIPALLIFVAYYHGAAFINPYNSRELKKYDKLSAITFAVIFLFAAFGHNSSGKFDHFLGFIGVFALCGAVLLFSLYKLIHCMLRYVKSWRQYVKNNPNTGKLLSLDDSFEETGINPKDDY